MEQDHLAEEFESGTKRAAYSSNGPGAGGHVRRSVIMSPLSEAASLPSFRPATALNLRQPPLPPGLTNYRYSSLPNGPGRCSPATGPARRSPSPAPPTPPSMSPWRWRALRRGGGARRPAGDRRRCTGTPGHRRGHPGRRAAVPGTGEMKPADGAGSGEPAQRRTGTGPRLRRRVCGAPRDFRRGSSVRTRLPGEDACRRAPLRERPAVVPGWPSPPTPTCTWISVR